MTSKQFDDLNFYFGVLKEIMKIRDSDCAEPKTMVDKGYSLAVRYMEIEISMILSDLEKQICEWS